MKIGAAAMQQKSVKVSNNQNQIFKTNSSIHTAMATHCPVTRVLILDYLKYNHYYYLKII